ncbi:uncharacterized protein EI97DRAFT_443704 [Westerdykella ornata]|uniref:Uncharacterized protein n=1 Tax=Westerdykella ornata TaxID=318751 RepID=A0A6A6JEX1_WESOR|nr:uncharacterized protein EI97DRAFT_443704 [Westerdykella ornata]KAF2274815.1 hypothetical protein EI97DRAFT_443704 [Westerdykella ornata]
MSWAGFSSVRISGQSGSSTTPSFSTTTSSFSSSSTSLASSAKPSFSPNPSSSSSPSVSISATSSTSSHTTHPLPRPVCRHIRCHSNDNRNDGNNDDSDGSTITVFYRPLPTTSPSAPGHECAQPSASGAGSASTSRVESSVNGTGHRHSSYATPPPRPPPLSEKALGKRPVVDWRRRDVMDIKAHGHDSLVADRLRGLRIDDGGGRKRGKGDVRRRRKRARGGGDGEKWEMEERRERRKGEVERLDVGWRSVLAPEIAHAEYLTVDVGEPGHPHLVRPLFFPLFAPDLVEEEIASEEVLTEATINRFRVSRRSRAGSGIRCFVHCYSSSLLTSPHPAYSRDTFSLSTFERHSVTSIDQNQDTDPIAAALFLPSYLRHRLPARSPSSSQQLPSSSATGTSVASSSTPHHSNANANSDWREDDIDPASPMHSFNTDYLYHKSDSPVVDIFVTDEDSRWVWGEAWEGDGGNRVGKEGDGGMTDGREKGEGGMGEERVDGEQKGDYTEDGEKEEEEEGGWPRGCWGCLGS